MKLSFFLLFLYLIALSTDTLVAGMDLGLSGIRFSFWCILLFCTICSSLFQASLLGGHQFFCNISSDQVRFFSFFLLLLLAIYKLSEVKRTKSLSKTINRHVPAVYSAKETFFLACLLSIDAICAGFTMSPPFPSGFLFPITFGIHFILLNLGLFLGKHLSGFSLDFSYLSAILFFLLAISKLFC